MLVPISRQLITLRLFCPVADDRVTGSVNHGVNVGVADSLDDRVTGISATNSHSGVGIASHSSQDRIALFAKRFASMGLLIGSEAEVRRTFH